MKLIPLLLMLSSISWAKECPNQEAQIISCEAAAEAYMEEVCSQIEEPQFKTGNEDLDIAMTRAKAVSDIQGIEDEDGFKLLSRLGVEYKKQNLADCLKDDLLSDETCLASWKYETGTRYLGDAMMTAPMKASLNKLNDRFQTVADVYLANVSRPWYFQLDPNTKENLPLMNKMMRTLAGVVASEKSLKVLKNAFKKAKELGVTLEVPIQVDPMAGNASNTLGEKYKYDLLNYFLVGKEYQWFIRFNPQFIYAARDPQNDYLMDFILSHELAHTYTMLVHEKMGGRLSRESLMNMKKRHQVCLYHDGERKEKYTEDLADLLTSSILNELHQGIDPSSLENLAKGFCRMRGDETGTHSGHSHGEDRFSNLVRHSEHLQAALGCKEERLSCTIRIKGNKN